MAQACADPSARFKLTPFACPQGGSPGIQGRDPIPRQLRSTQGVAVLIAIGLAAARPLAALYFPQQVMVERVLVRAPEILIELVATLELVAAISAGYQLKREAQHASPLVALRVFRGQCHWQGALRYRTRR